MTTFTVLIISAIIATISCRPDGPPLSACGDLMPGHTDSSKFDDGQQYMIGTSSTEYGPGNTITVTVSLIDATLFRGIIMQARSKIGGTTSTPAVSTGTTPVGRFSDATTGTKTLTCTAADDTWGHADRTDKTSVSVTWTAPTSGDAGDLVFVATIVQQNSGGTSIFFPNLWSEFIVYNASLADPITTSTSGPSGDPMTTRTSGPAGDPMTTSTSGSVRASFFFTLVILLAVAISRRFL